MGRSFHQGIMSTEQIMLLVAILGLLTAALTLGKSYLEYETVRLKNELQKKINAAAKKKESLNAPENAFTSAKLISLAFRKRSVSTPA